VWILLDVKRRILLWSVATLKRIIIVVVQTVGVEGRIMKSKIKKF
jgi:hypothetical protein